MKGPTLYERFEGALERFSDRERVLLIIMMCVVSVMLLIMVGYLGSQSLSTKREANDTRRELIDRIIEQRESIAMQKAEQDRIEGMLNTNTLRLSTFVEERGSMLGIGRPREFVDGEEPGAAGVTEYFTTVAYPNLSPIELDDLLREIHLADELVYIQSIETMPARGRSTTGLDTEITLVTYRRDGSGGDTE